MKAHRYISQALNLIGGELTRPGATKTIMAEIYTSCGRRGKTALIGELEPILSILLPARANTQRSKHPAEYITMLKTAINSHPTGPYTLQAIFQYAGYLAWADGHEYSVFDFIVAYNNRVEQIYQIRPLSDFEID